VEALLVALLFIFLFLFSLFYLRNTPLEVSFRRGGFAGLFLFREILGLIGTAAVILNIYSPEDFHGFRNTSEQSVFPISLILIYALFVFVIFVGAALKLLFRGVYARQYASQLSGGAELGESGYQSLVKLGLVLALAGLLVNFAGVLLYGARHAFLTALISGESLLSVRLSNIYVANMPTVFNSFMSFCATLLVVILGAVSYRKHRMVAWFFAIVVLYLSTFGGGKAPLVNSVIIYFVSYASFAGWKVKLKTVGTFLVSVCVVFGLVYFAVWVQLGGVTIGEFSWYIVNRLGVGQMAGVYEQFNLKIQNVNYIWHAVPFAGFFIDYPIFQKDLMMASEYVLDASATGLKNSLFISEAYAFGGFLLVALSPAIVGISYALSIFVVYYLISRLFVCNEVAALKISGLFFVPYLTLTGGFSEWLFMKALIMLLIFIAPIYLLFRFVGGLLNIRFYYAKRVML